MTDQADLEELHHRLVVVLRERLAEAEDDEARQAAWEAARANSALVGEVACLRCGKDYNRHKDGVCLPCVADLVKQTDRFARLVKDSKKHGLWVFPTKKAHLIQ